MKHICHITTVHPERDTRIFHKECKSLALAGYKVKLLVINGESFEEEGVKVIGVPCKFSGRLQRFRKASKAIYNKALSLDADLYHFHDPEFLPFAAKLVKMGKTVIYDVHEDLPRQIESKYYIPKSIRKLTATVVEYFENHYARKINGIITATTYIKERFEKIGDNVIAIQNFPSINAEGLKDSIEKPNAICYIGIITKIRGITELIHSLEGKDTTLHLAGNFSPENYKTNLESESGWSNVEYIGYADRSKIQQIYARSFAGIVTFHPEPNHINAQPNKLFEYMAGGLPLIASNFPLWRDIVEGNQCGICVDPMNPKEISQAIDYLYANPKDAQKMGANGRKAVMGKYNWGMEKKKLLEFYKKMLND